MDLNEVAKTMTKKEYKDCLDSLCYKPCSWHWFSSSQAAWNFFRTALEEGRSVGWPGWLKETNKHFVQEEWVTAGKK